MKLNKIYNMNCIEGMRLMIEQGLKVDAVITDPPYGTTAIACINTNRNYIGFELDESYWRIANERIAEHQAQLKLEL